MEHSNDRHIPWALFVSELIGTALLVLVGLSLVIFMFGTGTPMARLIPSEGLRSLITGFLFGTTGASIALNNRYRARCKETAILAFWAGAWALPAARLAGRPPKDRGA